MHVILLRLALALYSVGFAHSVLTALTKTDVVSSGFGGGFGGFILHVASIGLRAWDVHYLPLTQQYEAFSFSAP